METMLLQALRQKKGLTKQSKRMKDNGKEYGAAPQSKTQIQRQATCVA